MRSSFIIKEFLTFQHLAINDKRNPLEVNRPTSGFRIWQSVQTKYACCALSTLTTPLKKNVKQQKPTKKQPFLNSGSGWHCWLCLSVSEKYVTSTWRLLLFLCWEHTRTIIATNTGHYINWDRLHKVIIFFLQDDNYHVVCRDSHNVLAQHSIGGGIKCAAFFHKYLWYRWLVFYIEIIGRMYSFTRYT